MTHWRTDVDELLRIFRSSLLGVVPAMDEAHLPWRKPNSYDEWDSICETLYRVLVIESIRWAYNSNDQPSFPAYDTLYDTYDRLSFIELLPTDGRSETLLFHSFDTEQEPFDLVVARAVSEEGDPLSEELSTFPYSETRFRLRLKQLDGSLAEVTTLNVDLR